MAGEDETIDVLVHLRDELSRAAERITRSIDDIGRTSARTAPVVADLGDEIDDAGDAAKRSAAQTALYNRELKKTQREAAQAAAANALLSKRLDAMSSRSGGKGWFGALTGSMKFGRFLKMALIPTILDAVSALSTLGGAAVAASLGGVAALAPLTGLLVAYPGYLAAVGQGFGVFKLATSGLGDALKEAMSSGGDPEKLAEAMKKLSPAARDFVRTMQTFKKPFAELKQAVGNALLPSMTRLMSVFRGYMPLVKSSLVGTAQVMASSVRGLGRYFQLASTQQKVGKIMAQNTAIISRFGRVAQSGVAILLNLLVAAGPMLVQIADDMAGFMASMEFKSGQGNGLRKFFDSTYSVMRKVLKFTEDITMALFNITKAGTSLGSEMGDSFLEMASNFRQFSESTEGVEKTKNWFAQMRPIVYEVGRLVADIGKAFAHWSMDPTVLGTLKSLRLDTLPNIIDMVDSAAGRFLPAIAKALGSILNIITNLFVLPSLLEIIANTLDTIATIIQKLPDPIKNILSLMLTLTTLFKVSGTIGFFKGIVGGAAGGAASAGIMSRAMVGLRSVVATSAFSLKLWAGGAATMGQAAGYAATEVKTRLTPALRVLGTVAKATVVLALLAIAGAAFQGRQEIDEMKKATEEAFKAFKEKPSLDTFTGIHDQMKTVQDEAHRLRGLDIVGTLFDSKTWADAPSWIGAKLTGNLDTWRGSLGEVDDEAAKLGKNYSEIMMKVGRATFETGMTSKQTFEAMEEWNLDPLILSQDEFTASVKSYVWITYQADERTRIVAQSLRVLSDATAGATQKVDAFKAALDALQPDQSFKDATATAVRELRALGNTQKENNKFFKSGATDVDVSTRGVKKYTPAILDLHEALKSQTSAMNAATAARYKETGSMPAAMAVYDAWYAKVKNKVIKGYTDAGWGAKDAETKANEVMDAYARNPETVKTIFEQPWVQKALANGATMNDILRDIPNHVPVTITLTVTGYNSTAARLDRIATKLKNIDKSADRAPAGADGGFFFGGIPTITGERGPEMFVGSNGFTQMVGMRGQETVTFPTDGFIIPNHKLPTVTAPVEGATGRTTTMDSYAELPPVQVGPVYVNEPMDLERAVARGIRKAQRDREERGGR